MLPTLLASSSLGAVLSLATALCWAISPLCFASAARRIGSYPVTLLRATLAAVMLAAITPFWMAVADAPWPSAAQFAWLAASGLAGMVIGDALLYESYVRIGPRRATQILSLAPVASVILAWVWLDETLGAPTLVGITLVLLGTSYAVLVNPAAAQDLAADPRHVTFAGVCFAVCGAIGVGVGAVLARRAFQSAPPLDATMATAIRVGTSAAMLWVLPLVRGGMARSVRHLNDRFVLWRLVPGTLVGPFGGMLCYIFALKYLQAGPVSTLSAMSPLFILPMVAYRYRVRITVPLVAASLLAAAGVALICM